MSFSNVSPSHGLQFYKNCSSMGPFHGVQSFSYRLLQRGSPTGSQVLPANLLQCGVLFPWVHRCCQEPAQVQASHGVTASFGHIHLLWHGLLHGLQVYICSTVDLHGLQEISAPAPGTPPPCLSGCDCCCAKVFFALLKYVITEALPPSLMGLALASSRSIVESAGTGSIRHGGSFWQLLTEATSAAPPLPKPCHANPQQWFTLKGGERNMGQEVCFVLGLHVLVLRSVIQKTTQSLNTSGE